MSDIITFLTSEEIIMVYAIAFFSAVLCLLIFIAQKTYEKRNQKHNTMELNRLVEEIKEHEMMETKEATPIVAIEPEVEKTQPVIEPVKEIPVAIIPEVIEVEKEEIKDTATDAMISNIIEPKEQEEIQYENIVPDQTTAQKELEKLTKELQKAEENVQNIELTEFEAEQEENAIISLEELLEKGNSLYEKNEITQYQDEGNEPITLQDLEERIKLLKENEVTEIKTEKESVEVVTELTEEPQEKIMQTSLNLGDVTTETAKPYQSNHTFKSSPIISPIYGIEGKTSVQKQTELELENTATLKKFDDEIRKTNEFVMTLKELQKNLGEEK